MTLLALPAANAASDSDKPKFKVSCIKHQKLGKMKAKLLFKKSKSGKKSTLVGFKLTGKNIKCATLTGDYWGVVTTVGPTVLAKGGLDGTDGSVRLSKSKKALIVKIDPQVSSTKTSSWVFKSKKGKRYIKVYASSYSAKKKTTDSLLKIRIDDTYLRHVPVTGVSYVK